jgi:hypothetical protein
MDEDEVGKRREARRPPELQSGAPTPPSCTELTRGAEAFG